MIWHQQQTESLSTKLSIQISLFIKLSKHFSTNKKWQQVLQISLYYIPAENSWKPNPLLLEKYILKGFGLRFIQKVMTSYGMAS